MKSEKNDAGYLSAPEFQKRIKELRGIILPCGSCEQHGHHLPLNTDNLISEELALRIAEKTNLLVMPSVNYGEVWSARGFPGTVSLSPATFKQLLRDIVISLEAQNIRHIVLLSGHNGNYPVFREFAREMLDEFGWQNIWYFPITQFSPEVLLKASSPAPLFPHAGEIETSIMLYLHPELVDMSKATCEFPEVPDGYAYRPMHWNEFVHTGSFGNSCCATAEFGRLLVEDAVNKTAERINCLLV